MNISQYYSRPRLAARRLKEYVVDQAILNGLRTGHDSYQRFILLCYYRTGSNYLLSLLKSHEAVIAYSELFLTNSIAWSDGVYGRMNTNKLLHLRNNCPVDFLDEFVFRKYAPTIRAVGYKFIYSQFEKPRWNLLNESLKNMDIKIIHLKRDNLLNIIVSMTLMQQTNKASFISRRKVDDLMSNISTITLNYMRLVAQFQKLERQADICESYFRNLQSTTIKYSALLDQPQLEAARIFSFLEVPTLGIDKIHSPLQKINRKHNREIISNYDELATKFNGTKYEWYFD